MQHNYYFLKQLSAALAVELEGLLFVSCFSQNKDELLLGFANQERGFYIRALLSSVLCCLSFPNGYNRSRKNSIDLFEAANGLYVQAVRQFENDRSFALYLSKEPKSKTMQEKQEEQDSTIEKTEKIILFKMYGQRGNVVLFEQDEQTQKWVVTEIFKSELEKDWLLDLDQLDKKIVQDATTFEQQGWQKTFPTFDKEIINFLEKTYQKNMQQLSFQEISQQLPLLEKPNYFVYSQNKALYFSLFAPLEKSKKNLSDTLEVSDKLQLSGGSKPPDNYNEKYQYLSDTSKVSDKLSCVLLQTTNPLLALNEFYHTFIHTYYFEEEKKNILKKLETQIKQTANYIWKTEQKLLDFIGSLSFEQIANIIMANLHQIPTQPNYSSSTIELFDFYNNKPLVIKLKENLTPQKLAETYYKKGKNQKKEIDTLEANLLQKQTKLQQVQQHFDNLQRMTDFAALRAYIKTHDLEEKIEEKQALQLFKRFECEGFEILVGKNAANNDLLTQRHTYKEDLWLHARDVTGSHVVVKYQAGKKFPAAVVQRAAELAAYFSKRKHESICPVIYTPKKFVRKPKGAAQGAVKIEREQVLLVKPNL